LYGPIPACMPVLNHVARVCAGLLTVSLILRIKGFRKRKKKNNRSLQRRHARSDMRTRIRGAFNSADNISIVALVIWVVYSLITGAYFQFSDSMAEFFRVAIVGYWMAYTASVLFLASKFLAITPKLASSGSARIFKLFLIGVFLNSLQMVPTIFLLKTYEEEMTGCSFPAMPSFLNVAFAFYSAVINACGFKLFRQPFRYMSVGDTSASSSGNSATQQIIQRNFISMCITGSSTIVFQTSLAIAGNNPFLFKNVAMPLAMVDVVMNSFSINVAFGDLKMLWCCKKSSPKETSMLSTGRSILQSSRRNRKVIPVQSSLVSSREKKEAPFSDVSGSGRKRPLDTA